MARGFAEKSISGLERKFGLLWTSLFLSGLVIFCAVIYTRPNPVDPLQSHPRLIAKMSENPLRFSSRNRLQYRILTPLVAHYTGFQGSYLKFFNLILASSLLSLVYVYFRRRQFEGDEALAMMMMLGFSTPILFFLHFPFYYDLLSYLLIFLAIIFIRNAYVWPALFALSLFNHEANVFIFPFLIGMVILGKADKKHWMIAAAVLAVCGAAYLMFRSYIDMNYRPRYHSSFYLKWDWILRCFRNLWVRPEEVFYAFRLFWFFPLVAMDHYLRQKNYFGALWLGASLLSVGLVALLGSDITRLLGLAFPIVLFSLIPVREAWGPQKFKTIVWVFVILNLITPIEIGLGKF